jgi:prepilin-type N-terminal cleavage/methylation domain-containing protein
MKNNNSRTGMTLVEVMISMFLVSVAAIIVYTEMLLSYRILMRTRARIEAQSIAFDRMWTYYNNTKITSLPIIAGSVTNASGPTPAWSVLSTNGWVDMFVFPNAPAGNPNAPTNWILVARVWPPANSLLRIGTNPLACTAITRYNTADRKNNLP